MKKLKAVTTIIGIIGLIMMLGTAGTSDQGTLQGWQFAEQYILSISLMAVGLIGQIWEVV